MFAQHNLASDRSFNEFNVVLCRNVLIYFGRDLQRRVHRLFYDSLARFGVLGLGQKETLRFTDLEDRYEELDPRREDLPEGRLMAFELIAIGGVVGRHARAGDRARAAACGLRDPRSSSPSTARGGRRGAARAGARAQLASSTSRPATDKEPLRPGHVYVAPADYHLLVEPGHLALSTDDRVQFSRPSIDVLFESAAETLRRPRRSACC